jgi:hypothetical protein
VKDVLVLCPQQRDFEVIRAAGLQERYRVRYVGSDLDSGGPFDARAFLERCTALRADAVLATKDRSALLAALVAERLALAGPKPEAVIHCQHKPTSRALQREVAQEATPRFAVLEGGAPPFPPPFFVKPVIGRLSQHARRIDDPAELRGIAAADDYAEGWAEIAALAGFPADAARGYIVEELLTGDEVTLEGYVHGGRVTVIGTTDSVKYPGTASFERFEYPSRLSSDRHAELHRVAARLLPALGFDGGFFNVEFVVPEGGPARIVEVNGRIASQFAPLVEAVHGRSSYDALFALAAGDDPRWDTRAPDGVAISYALRTFRDALVAAVPDPEPGLELLVRPGLRLSEQGANDAFSYRLAIFYETGETREEAVERSLWRARSLRDRFELRPPA